MPPPTAFPWDDHLLAERVRTAVIDYWLGRSGQSKRQGKRTKKEAGTRKEVIGGKHLDSFLKIVEETASAAGFTREEILRSTGVELPGYFRAQKRWDLIVVRRDRLCAAIELKSQVGAFGNNFNNRSEEAIGNATDLWTAFREGALGREQPWLGYFFLLEDAPKSRAPVGLKAARFKPFPVFEGTSYAERYALLCERLVLERKYTKTALVLTPRGQKGDYSELRETSLGFRAFLISLHAHLVGCR